MSQCVRDKLQSSDGLYRRPMVLFALDSGLSPVGTPSPTSMSTIYLSPSNLGSSTAAIASRGGRMTLRAIGGLNELLYVDLSRRDLNDRTSTPLVSLRIDFSNLMIDSRRIVQVANHSPPVHHDLQDTPHTEND